MPVKIAKLDTRTADAAASIAQLRAKLAADGDVVSEAGRQRTIDVFGQPLSPREVVARICGDVKDHGLSAVLDYSRRIDGADLDATSLRVPADDLASAHAAADPSFLDTVRRIRDNILRFQTAILHQDVSVDIPDGGGTLRQRYMALNRVGLCVPGGAAAYPSTVLMTAVPAQAAGVEQLAVVAPPTQNGAYNRDMLATCQELGITEVYRVGGAQAVAMLAYGADSVPKVDKIVGPGNLFVALAKQRVYGEVDIDSIAGPSEVIVVADASVPTAWVAADLIAQAEHSPGASVLITWEEGVADGVGAELERQLDRLDRADLARAALEAFGALIVVRDRNEAVALTNDFAPEHLHIQCDGGEELVDQMRNAGATFVGPHSPVALGDYVAGPSHVLPTGATARFASGLCANDFVRSSSVIQFSESGLARVADDAQLMAQQEGLTGHGHSVAIRANR